MSALIGKAGKKLFEKHMEQYAPADPVYEYYTDERGKRKRKKRELPLGLSARDARILKSVKKRARRLDKGFSLCGFKFGWAAIIGLVPVVGDAADILLNYWFVVRKARQADLPFWLVQRMLLNNAVSAAVGFIPFVGDVILAAYKANSRNAALLEEFLRLRGEEFIKIRERGGDPDAAQKVRAKSKGKKKDTGKGESSKLEKAEKGVSKHGAEQVKAGAGVGRDEVVKETISGTTPGSESGVISASPSGSAGSKGNNKRIFSFATWGRNRPAPESRFVENISGSTSPKEE